MCTISCPWTPRRMNFGKGVVVVGETLETMNQTDFLAQRLFRYNGKIQVLMPIEEAVSLLEKAGAVPAVANSTKPGAHKQRQKPGPKPGFKKAPKEGVEKKVE